MPSADQVPTQSSHSASSQACALTGARLGIHEELQDWIASETAKLIELPDVEPDEVR